MTLRPWRRLAGLLVGLAIASAAAAAAASAGPGPVVARSPVHRASAGLSGCSRTGTTQVLHVRDGTARGGWRGVWVYRPVAPESAELPVTYVLHGLPGGFGDAADAGLAAVLDAAACAGSAPMVVVAPDGNDAGHHDTEWGDSAAGATTGGARLETFVTQTLVGVVEGAHRRAASRRAIAGFSMGGYGATALALRHRDLYGQLAALSGYFHIDDPDHVFGADSAAHDPLRLASQARGLRVLLATASDDDDPVTRGETGRYAQVLRRVGAQPATLVVPGRHDVAFFSRVLPAVVDFLGEGFATGSR